MEVNIISSETLGTRSLATLVKCEDINILIDPGVALGPRFGLMPHELEYRELYNARKKIEEISKFIDLVCITHYHYDHYTPFWEKIDNLWTFASSESATKIYSNKVVYLKDFYNNINYSQRERAKEFIPKLKRVAREVKIADEKEVIIGNVKLKFSKAVPHGEENTPLGYVIMVIVEEKGEKFIFGSDIEGPMSNHTYEIIVKEKPDVLLLSGPPLYLVGSKVSMENFKKGIENLKMICKKVPNLIVDHHLLRSTESLSYINELKNIAENYKNKVMLVAEKEGKEINMLEAKRKELYERIPISNKFKNWIKVREGSPINFD
jgi:Predicted hydrolase (metallo-beta-lactamase superfamily)